MNIFSDIYFKKSDKFSSPTVIEDFQSPYNLSMVDKCISNEANSASTRLSADFRLYIKNRQINSIEGKKKLLALSKLGVENVQDWGRALGSEDYLLFINFAGAYCQEMMSTSRGLISNFAKNFEGDPINAEHHIIIGKYVETPFGVHIDDPNDRVIHFNLGPNSKRLILWPREQYTRKYGFNYLSFDEVGVENSRSYELAPGSAFCLPSSYFHVGQSSFGVSVVVALAFSRRNLRIQIEDIIFEYTSDIDQEESNTYWDSFLGKFNSSLILGAKKYFSEENFDKYYEDALCRLRSNGYLVDAVKPNISPLPTCDLKIRLDKGAINYLTINTRRGEASAFLFGSKFPGNISNLHDKFDNLMKGEFIKIDGEKINLDGLKGNDFALFLLWLNSFNVLSIEEVIQ